MAKVHSHYVCQTCGSAFAKWLGRCTSCGAWNTLVEETAASGKGKGKDPLAPSRAELLRDVPEDHAARLSTGLPELDRVLGGGAVIGGVTLLGGDPGVGKSTLLMQALAGIAHAGHRTLYVTGEESAGQTAARARRLGAHVTENFFVLAENDLDTVLAALAEVKPAALVLDSVQTIRSSSLESAAGTVSQLREVASQIVQRSKQHRIASFLVGHVTKDGTLAGPKVLEHLVDTVLQFEGERAHAFRTVRAAKNRFGSATEVGVFEMHAEGLVCVPNPSALFLAERPKGAAGSVICATAEGSRPMLVEVQALVAKGAGRRVASGIDSQRLAMILAVLERRAGLVLVEHDVFVNVAGGLRVDEPAADLAIALAVASSARDAPVDSGLVAFGEIGLTGEVRSVARASLRIAEAESMGFSRALGPVGNAVSGGGQSVSRKNKQTLTHTPVQSLAAALAIVFAP